MSDEATLSDLTSSEAGRPIQGAEPVMTGVPGERNAKNKAFVQAVAEANVRIAARNLAARSKVLRDLVAANSLRIATAMHDISTGRVAFSA